MEGCAAKGYEGDRAALGGVFQLGRKLLHHVPATISSNHERRGGCLGWRVGDVSKLHRYQLVL